MERVAVNRAIRCFLIEPTSVWARALKRWTASGMPCPMARDGKLHYATVPIGTLRSDRPPASGDVWPHDDARWPSFCDCGYLFEPEDYWGVHHQQLYLRHETGNTYTLADAPAGAMWFADWSPHHGEDGRSVVVKTPVGEWQIDAPAKDGTRWRRTGTVPCLDVAPAIKLGEYIATLHGGIILEWPR